LILVEGRDDPDHRTIRIILNGSITKGPFRRRESVKLNKTDERELHIVIPIVIISFSGKYNATPSPHKTALNP